ncbi:hypothetical protein [Sorangium sp. So ce1153]
MKNWEPLVVKKLEATDLGDDPAHDLAHITRVVATAKALAATRGTRVQ